MKSTGRNRSYGTILFVHASADLYGSDITLLQLVAGLDRNRFKALVVLPYDGPLVPHLREAGAEVIVRPEIPVIRRQHMNPTGLLRLLVALRSVGWLAKFICQRDVTLVHCNTLAVALVSLAAKLSGRPQVWHVHEIIVRPRTIASVLATLSSVMSTLIVANSRATADHYCRTRVISSTPIRIILNGVDEPRLQDSKTAELRTLLRARPKEVVFALVGRINRLKGHSVFLDAAEHLAAELEGVRFLIVGDSFAGQEHLTKAVDERIRSSEILRERVTRLPYVADVVSVYEACDVVVVPSIEPESFGLVAAEAMAAGLPVIASRIGALPELVEDERTGLLSDPGDTASLLKAMRSLGVSPLLRDEMGRRGRQRFEREFRVQRYVREFNEVYEELAGRGVASVSSLELEKP